MAITVICCLICCLMVLFDKCVNSDFCNVSQTRPCVRPRHYFDVLLTMRGAVWLCSPWYNLHRVEFEVVNVQSRASPQYKMIYQHLVQLLLFPSRVGDFIEATSLFHTPTPAQKINPSHQSDHENEKSKQHKHHKQTWGRAVIQARLAPIRNKSTSSLLTSNCWWHQSRFQDCLVRNQASAVPMQSRQKSRRGTTHATSHPYRKRQGWKRQTVKRQNG